MKNVIDIIKKSINKKTILVCVVLSIITILFFAVPIAVYPDSLGYYNYLKIFNGLDSFASWNPLRGPSLPIVLYLSVLFFGSVMFGILMGAYLFFISLLIICFVVLKKVINMLNVNLQTKNIAINPILFGYYHALLTEYVATFFALVSCVLAWRWLKIDFISKKIKYIIYNLIFIFLFIFMWFLKQPYLTIAIFPLLIAGVISILRDFKLKNIVQRIVTIAVCVLCLVFAISGWRSFLISSGAIANDSNSIDNQYISSGIIDGISNARQTISDDVDIAKIDADKFLSQADKDRARQIISSKDNGGSERVQLLNILNTSGVQIDTIPIFQAHESLTTQEAIDAWARVSAKYPLLVLDSYISNYFAIAGLYRYNADAHVGVLYPVRSFSIQGHENHSIGLLYTDYAANMAVWTRDSMTYPGLEYRKNEFNKDMLMVIKLYGIMHGGLYLVLYMLLPVALVYAVIAYRRLLKKLKRDELKLWAYELVLILLGFSFLHVMFNDVLGAIIDRYAYVTFPCVALGFILLLAMNEKLQTLFGKINFKKSIKLKKSRQS